MRCLLQHCLIALFFVFSTVSFGADVKVLPLNAPNLPNEKLYATITTQVLNAVQETGNRSVENADYALRVTVLNPKGFLMVGAEVRGINSFYKKESVNVSNVSMLDDGLRQVIGAVLKDIPTASDIDEVSEIPSMEPLVKVDTVTKRDTITRVDTIVKIDTIAKVDTIIKVETITVVDTIERDEANLVKKSMHYIMVGFSFANLFFLREYTEHYLTASRSYSSNYNRRYDIYNTEKIYTTEEQERSNQLNLGYAYETPINTRLSRVYSADFGFNNTDWFLGFAGNLKFDLIKKHPLRKWNLFIQGGLGPVFAYIGTFTADSWDNVDASNAIKSLGHEIEASFHLGAISNIALGFDYNIKGKSKLEFAVRIEQAWMDFLDKLSGNRMFAITPYVAYGF